MTRLPVSLLAATIALVPLTACHRKAPEPVAREAASEAAAPTVVVSGARLVLPAVSGNPAALYLTIANATEPAIRLTGIAVAGATSTELHETKGGTMGPLAGVDIAPGTASSLEPGARHAMVMGLAPTPKPGAEIAVTLKFATGATVATTAKVEAVGDDMAMDKMPGMSGSMSGHDMKGMEGMH